MDFNPEKLEVNFMPPATSTSPIKNRKYTLTHSDETAMMFLDVGTNSMLMRRQVNFHLHKRNTPSISLI